MNPRPGPACARAPRQADRSSARGPLRPTPPPRKPVELDAIPRPKPMDALLGAGLGALRPR
eukprot:15465297-Alexandrium_andersonii.AAC.1